MRITRPLALFAAAAAAAMVLSSCSGGESAQPQNANGTSTAPLLTIGSLQEPSSWDPAQANEGHLAPVYQSVYDTLIKREPNGDLSPMLATEWSMGDDGLSLDLELRDDVTFTDGTPFDAEAVKANIEHFQTANGPLQSNLASIASVEVVDADSVTLVLGSPDPDLASNLSNAGGYMASPAALDSPDLAASPVGSGPYVLDASGSVVGSTIKLTRNDDYWGDPLPFDAVEFRILPDETARLNALTSGQIDTASLNRAASALQAQGAGLNAPDAYSVNWGGILFFDRDGALVPELADVRVREALAIAIDGQALVDVGWEGLGQTTSQVFGPDTDGYDESLEDAYAYDPERAKDLLAAAGAADLRITLPISPVFEPVIYDAIIQNWEDIGVTVDRHQWGPGEAVPSMQRGEFPLAFMNLAQRPDWNTTQFLLAPDAPWNPLGSTDPELEALIAQYPLADEAGQAAVSREINEWVVENVWFAPVMRPDNFIFFGNTITVEPQVQQAVPSIYNYSPSGN
ncbi:peptide/nickel transport system substrate-binding protein [Microbacterium sp. AG1240]|uniref:ABC transporter substrate-binding protein n=1 Tax=Microbacterium sp. AG1240 TaxID=2183992 RepID=UPI000EB2DF89|nr:ABC transporter substrate-binding protein [Microbacterium sp. AG1240]RKT35690.1 peptide/nickel transport system substrate-binding protein [Microbacterium sp. AG1240]